MGAQTATACQGACVRCFVKTFRKWRGAFKQAKQLPDGYIPCGSPEFQTSGSPALGGDIAMCLQLIYHLRQMVAGRVASLGDVGGAHGCVFVDGTKHQDARGEIGFGCEAHALRTFDLWVVLAPKRCSERVLDVVVGLVQHVIDLDQMGAFWAGNQRVFTLCSFCAVRFYQSISCACWAHP